MSRKFRKDFLFIQIFLKNDATDSISKKRILKIKEIVMCVLYF